MFRHSLTLLGSIAVLIITPYLGFVLVSILYPEFTRIKEAGPKFGIILIIVVMTISGYLIGSNHDHFLSCNDFEISGNHVPRNCSSR